MLTFTAICPHPPIIIPEIGQENLSQASQIVEAMKKLSEKFVESKPETVIIVSPHGPVEIDQMVINVSPTLAGDFMMFGSNLTMSFKNDLDVSKSICEKSNEAKIPVSLIENIPLDHGALVPLYYLTKNLPDVNLVPIVFSYLSYKRHFEFGKTIGEVIKKSNKKIAFIASGDLSHRLTPDAPVGYSPRGKEFDKKLIELIKAKNVKGILNLDPDLIDQAGECGLRSIIILLGVLDGLNWQPEILSYEGPFGVGYLVVNFKLQNVIASESEWTNKAIP